MDNESKGSRLSKERHTCNVLFASERRQQEALSLLIKIIPTKRVNESKSIKTIFDRVSSLTYPRAVSKERKHGSQTI